MWMDWGVFKLRPIDLRVHVMLESTQVKFSTIHLRPRLATPSGRRWPSIAGLLPACRHWWLRCGSCSGQCYQSATERSWRCGDAAQRQTVQSAQSATAALQPELRSAAARLTQALHLYSLIVDQSLTLESSTSSSNGGLSLRLFGRKVVKVKMWKAFKLIENDQTQNDLWRIVPAVSPVAAGEQPAFPKHQLLLQPLSLRKIKTPNRRPIMDEVQRASGGERLVYQTCCRHQWRDRIWTLGAVETTLTFTSDAIAPSWQRAVTESSSSRQRWLLIHLDSLLCMRLVLLLPHYIDCCTGCRWAALGILTSLEVIILGLVWQNTKTSRLLHSASPGSSLRPPLALESGGVSWRSSTVFGLWHRPGSTTCGGSPSERHDLSSDTELFVRPTHCGRMPPLTSLTSGTSPSHWSIQISHRPAGDVA